LGNGRLIIAIRLHLLPGVTEMYYGTANIEAFKEKTADCAVAHFSAAV
jgi:hypothetical protein